MGGGDSEFENIFVGFPVFACVPPVGVEKNETNTSRNENGPNGLKLGVLVRKYLWKYFMFRSLI
jgi:hypothetical protein